MMPLEFTCSSLYEHVGRAIGSPAVYIAYKLPLGLDGHPGMTFIPSGITGDRHLKAHFIDHVKKQVKLGKPVELYHEDTQ